MINYELDEWKAIIKCMKFEILTVISIKLRVCRNVTPCSRIDGWNQKPPSSGRKYLFLHSADEGSRFLQISLYIYTALCPRRQTSITYCFHTGNWGSRNSSFGYELKLLNALFFWGGGRVRSITVAVVL
jgi:hypothetical protein